MNDLQGGENIPVGRVPAGAGLAHHSISGRLALGLAAAAVLVSAITIAVLYVGSVQWQEANLAKKADEYQEYLVGALEWPLWNYDTGTVRAICGTFVQNELVTGVTVRDPSGHVVQTTVRDRSSDVVRRTARIYHEGTELGEVELWLSKRPAREAERRLLSSYAMVMLIVAVSLVLITRLSVRLLLKKPIGILDRMVRPYAQGIYDEPVPEMPYVEFQAIGQTLAQMGETIQQQISKARAAEAKYRDIYENALEGIFQTTPAGTFLSANPALARIHGYDSPEQFIASITDIARQQYVNPEDRLRFQQAIETRGFVERFEVEVWRKDGERIWISMSARKVRNADGTTRCYEGTTVDITHRKMTEEALKQAKEAADAANRTKDQFLAVLSHELRTPLTPVLAVASSLESHPALPAAIYADMELIRRNVELETKLIDDLLDLTRITQGKIDLNREVVDAHVCLRNALATCEGEMRSKRQEVVVDLRAQQHHVLADQTRLQQVFWNLIRNAAKFTPEGGRVCLRSYNDEDRVRIEVSDTGIGIDPEALSRIFNAFEQAERTKTRRFGGLGLGLAIAKSLVDLHQGRLTAASAGANQGATFTVDLAAMAPTAAPQPKVPEAPLEALAEQSERILLVEDSPDTLRVLVRLLRGWGYRVTGAGTVAEALKAARRQRYDLLISDIGLPDGSGLEVMQQLRQAGDEIRGIALSGYGRDEDIQQSKAAGFGQHLVKPVTAKTLAAAVRQMVSAA